MMFLNTHIYLLKQCELNGHIWWLHQLSNIIIFHQHVMCLCSVKWCEVVVATLLDDKGHPIWILVRLPTIHLLFPMTCIRKG